MVNITKLIEQIKWIPTITVTPIDVIQVIILSFVFYWLIKTLRDTRAWILVKGLLIIGIIYITVCLLDMTVLQSIMQGLFSALMIAIVIMLQPELQKIIELIGKKNTKTVRTLFTKKSESETRYSEKTIEEVVAACEEMALNKTGALIVFEKDIPLQEHINSGIILNSDISRQLLINIFEKNTPLHDGAIILQNDKVKAATCYLPLSTNDQIDKHFGTRHRAALGISETSDCLVIIVSEETGNISVCVDGNIIHNISPDTLKKKLEKFASSQKIENKNKKKTKTPIWVLLFAPIISVIVWFYVINVNDPITTRTIASIPVHTINTSLVSESGQSYSIQSGKTVTAKIQGKRSVVYGITTDDIYASADFSEMSIVHAVPIRVSVHGHENSVNVSLNTDIMKLTMENTAKVDIPIEVNLTGNNNENLFAKLSGLDVEKITVTCPESLAKTLNKAVITVDASEKETDFISTVKPVIYDKNGTIVKEDKIVLSHNNVVATIDMYDVKEVPFTVRLSEQNTDADCYYKLHGYECEIESIRIAGDEEKLKEIQSLDFIITPDINNEMADSMVIHVTEQLPEGIVLANNQEEDLSVIVNVSQYKKVEYPISEESVAVAGTTRENIVFTLLPETLSFYYDAVLVNETILSLEAFNPTLKVEDVIRGRYDGVLTVTDIEGVKIINELNVSYQIVESVESE